LTVDKFIVQIEAYYGKYRVAVRDVVAGYVEGMKPESRRVLFSLLIKEYSGRYNFVPDLAAIRKTWRAYKEEQYYKDEPANRLQIEGEGKPQIEDMVVEVRRLRDHLAMRPVPKHMKQKRGGDRMRELERMKAMAALEELKAPDFKRRVLASKSLDDETPQERYERLAGELEREKTRWEKGED